MIIVAAINTTIQNIWQDLITLLLAKEENSAENNKQS
jgi:hypothetical protein